MSKIITVEEIISIHDMLVDRNKGEKWILNMGELEVIVYWVNSHPEKHFSESRRFDEGDHKWLIFRRWS